MARSLVRVRDRLLDELAVCSDIGIRSGVVRSPTTNRPGFTQTHHRWITELSLLKATVAWEIYLEHALAHYVLGHRAPRGRRFARKKQLRGVTLEAVRKTFSGDKDFVSWIEFSAVTKRAEEWLKDGEPFKTVLGSAGSPLAYVKVLRNAVAHNSDTAWLKFETQTRALYGALPRNATPGSQLLLPPAPSLSLGSGILLEEILNLFRALSTRITP